MTTVHHPFNGIFSSGMERPIVRPVSSPLYEPPKELKCRLCGERTGRLGDQSLSDVHRLCEAKYTLEVLVPTWPKGQDREAEIVRWERAFPELPWRARWGQAVSPPPASAPRPPELREPPPQPRKSPKVRPGAQPRGNWRYRVECEKCGESADSDFLYEANYWISVHRLESKGHSPYRISGAP